MRVLIQVKCKYCGHECDDINMEKIEFKKVDKNTTEVICKMICPNCKKEQN